MLLAHHRGTLVVPGSHNLISEVGAGNPVGPLPPAINAECPAGTVVMFEGRLLHGTGVNKTDKPRRMYVSPSCATVADKGSESRHTVKSNCTKYGWKTYELRNRYVGNSLKPSFRQQELWALSLKPEVMVFSPFTIVSCISLDIENGCCLDSLEVQQNIDLLIQTGRADPENGVSNGTTSGWTRRGRR